MTMGKENDGEHIEDKSEKSEDKSMEGSRAEHSLFFCAPSLMSILISFQLCTFIEVV